MKNRLGVAVFIVSALLISACGQQDTESLQDTKQGKEFETTEDGYLPLNDQGAKIYDQSGETWDLDKDKETIIEAAEKVPGVQVKSVHFEHSTAKVTVDVEEKVNDDERIAWSNNIRSAIEGAIQRYNIQVFVK